MDPSSANTIYLLRDAKVIKKKDDVFQHGRSTSASFAQFFPNTAECFQVHLNDNKFRKLFRAHIHNYSGYFLNIFSSISYKGLTFTAEVNSNFMQDLDTLNSIHNNEQLSTSSINNMKIIVEGQVDLFIDERIGNEMIITCSRKFRATYHTKQSFGFPTANLECEIPATFLLSTNTSQSIQLTVSAYLDWSVGCQSGSSIKNSLTSIKRSDDFLKKLYENEKSKDFKIVAGDGTEIKCHRLVLTVCSDVFQTILGSKDMRESQTGVLELKVLSKKGLNHFINYLYGLEISTSDLTPDLALELMQTGHAYGLPNLVQAISNFLMGKSNKWYAKAGDVLFEMYFFAFRLENRFEPLANHLLGIMARMPSQEIMTKQKFQELSKEEAFDLMCKLFDLRRMCNCTATGLEGKGQVLRNEKKNKLDFIL